MKGDIMNQVIWKLNLPKGIKISVDVTTVPSKDYKDSTIAVHSQEEIIQNQVANSSLNENKQFESDFILWILQDVFYVTQLDHLYERWQSIIDKQNKKGETNRDILDAKYKEYKKLKKFLNQRDNYWNFLRFIWHKLMIIVNENLEDFQNDMTNEDLKSILKEVDFSENPSFKEFRGPFATRFEIYQLLSILSATQEKPREIKKNSLHI